MSKILIISDSSKTLDFFRQCLCSEGYQILTASDGLEGINLAQCRQPDLIICDVLASQDDCYAVLSHLRDNIDTAIIPFIFLTTRFSREETRYGMVLGADDYLIKPYTTEEILSAVSARLSRQKILRQWYTSEYQIQQSNQFSHIEHELPPKTDSIFPNIPKLEKIFTFIEKNFRQSITLGDIAKVMNYSPTYMTHLVKCKTQRSVHRWIIERRMLEARKLLLEGGLTVKEIALQVGYNEPCYFTRQFKKHHQVSPTAWQEKNGF